MGRGPDRQATKGKASFLRKIPKAAESIEKTLSLLEQLGIKQSVVAVVTSGLFAALVWVWTNVTWWVAVLVMLATTYWALGILIRLQRKRLLTRFDPKEFKALGDEVIELANKMIRLISDRDRDRPSSIPKGRGSPSNAWEKARAYDSVTISHIQQSYGAEMMRALALCRSIGIDTPFGVRLDEMSFRTVPVYLHLIGGLLSRGDLDAAQKISQDRSLGTTLLVHTYRA